jgi:hypothetical protein
MHDPEARSAEVECSWRSDWLAYCREVAGDSCHRSLCAEEGGSWPPDFAPDVRWPGYLGPDYRPGGVLWAANIHTRFDTRGLPASFAADAANSVRAFRDGHSDSDAFLAAMSDVYQQGLARWNVGYWGRRVLDQLGVPLSAVAYTNAAKCQAFGTAEGLQRLCQTQWPLRDTARMLAPALILITSQTALQAAGPGPWPCPVIALSQRNGRIIRDSPWQPPAGDPSPLTWIPELPRLADWPA